MQNLKKSFKKEFIKFIGITILFIVAIVLVILQKIKFETKTLLILILLIALLLFLLPIRRKILFYSERINYFRLVENKEGVLNTKIDPFTFDFINFLKDNNYSKNETYNFEHITTYYKFFNKKDTKLAKDGLLQVLILVDNDQINFNSELIQKEINSIEDLEKKKRFNKYSVVIIKKVNNITQNQIKRTMPHTRFEKYGVTHVIVLPVLYSKNQIFFLHNKNYSPNRYYKFTEEIIKNYLV